MMTERVSSPRHSSHLSVWSETSDHWMVWPKTNWFEFFGRRQIGTSKRSILQERESVTEVAQMNLGFAPVNPTRRVQIAMSQQCLNADEKTQIEATRATRARRSALPSDKETHLHRALRYSTSFRKKLVP
jgi:hypothetical protein